MCHSEQADRGPKMVPGITAAEAILAYGPLNSPGRSVEVAFEEAYPSSSPRARKAELRMLQAATEADQRIRDAGRAAEIEAMIRRFVIDGGAVTPRSMRDIAADCVRTMQTGALGVKLDDEQRMAWFKKYRDMLADYFFPVYQAEAIKATLTVSEMQGLLLTPPVAATTARPSGAAGHSPRDQGADLPPARERVGVGKPCPKCDTPMEIEPATDDYHEAHGKPAGRKYPAMWRCDSCTHMEPCSD